MWYAAQAVINGRFSVNRRQELIHLYWKNQQLTRRIGTERGSIAHAELQTTASDRSPPNGDALDSCLHDALFGYPVTASPLETAKLATRSTLADRRIKAANR